MARQPRFRRTVAQVVADYRSGAHVRTDLATQTAIWCETWAPKAMMPGLTVDGLEALAQIHHLGIPGVADLNVLFKQQYGRMCWNSILLFKDDEPNTWAIAFGAIDGSTDEFAPTWPAVPKGCFVRTPGTKFEFVYDLDWEQVIAHLRAEAAIAA